MDQGAILRGDLTPPGQFVTPDPAGRSKKNTRGSRATPPGHFRQIAPCSKLFVDYQ